MGKLEPVLPVLYRWFDVRKIKSGDTFSAVNAALLDKAILTKV